jgi:hypothetical protein
MVSVIDMWGYVYMACITGLWRDVCKACNIDKKRGAFMPCYRHADRRIWPVL